MSIVFAVVALVALAVSSALAASGPPAGRVAVPRLVWHRCDSPGTRGFQCATATVPLDYRLPNGPKIRLAVMRHRATEPARRIGTLFINPGGPGGPGTAILPGAYAQLPAALQARFDIASWDPRGVGTSTVVKCFPTVKDEYRFLDGMVLGKSFPLRRGEMDSWLRRYRAFDRRCARRSGRLLGHVSTADTARDLDYLRRAVGDRSLTYLGVSYGTFLGATYANLFPARVRALVLDGDLNPTAYVNREVRANSGLFLSTDLRQHTDQSAASTLKAFLDLCGRTDTARCAFSAGSAAATEAKFAALLRRLRAHPQGAVTYPSVVSDAGSTLYVTAQWPELAQRLQQVWATGHTSLPQHVVGNADAPLQSLGQTFAIRCSESPNPGPGGFRSLQGFAYRRSGPLGPWWLWQSVACADWPARAADRYAGPWNHRTANPILVIGNMHDPSTPYRGAVAMARQLARARLLTLNGYGHTSGADPSACVLRAKVAYLVQLRLPPRGTVCQPDRVPFDPQFGQPLH